jgi:hypothetical protein
MHIRFAGPIASEDSHGRKKEQCADDCRFGQGNREISPRAGIRVSWIWKNRGGMDICNRYSFLPVGMSRQRGSLTAMKWILVGSASPRWSRLAGSCGDVSPEHGAMYAVVQFGDQFIFQLIAIGRQFDEKLMEINKGVELSKVGRHECFLSNDI